MRRDQRAWAWAIGLVVVSGLVPPLGAAEIYVAPDGRDTNPGTQEKPFATLERARDEVRRLRKAGPPPAGGVTIEAAGGVYELDQPLALTAEDSGSPDAAIVYQARSGQTVRLVGGRRLSGWKPVGDPGVLARLAPEARANVSQTDLKAQGVTDFGVMGGGFGLSGGPGLELFYNEQPMTVARWPNAGFTRIRDVLGPTPVDIRGTKGTQEGIFVYEDDRPSRWVGESDAWVLGYWFWDWAEQRQRIASINPAKNIITVAEPYHGYGYRKGQWFYGFNILAELDTPGEWYLDRERGLLYFWPPSPLESGSAVVSLAPSLLTMKDVSHTTFRGITFEAARGTGIVIDGGENVRVVGCTLRNLGGDAIRISGGRGHAVVGCDISATGDGGVSLAGGDRRDLTPAGHRAENNHIHHWSRWNRMYRPGITLAGVGQTARNNRIEYSPHTAIGFSGNDHAIEYNEIHHVCMESNDAGAIYAGRNWTMRGTVIRFNYLHDITGFEGRGCVGVYLDDQFSGTLVRGNLFVRVARAAMIGGGRDCTIENNLFVDCTPATHVDARGLGWAASGGDGLRESLKAMPYTVPPWSTRYPPLVSILDDDPMAPRGNRIARNILVGGRWGDFEANARPLIQFQDNWLEGDPRLVDPAHGDYRLADDSPAWKLGFEPIPIDKIGVFASDDRASWPVHSTPSPSPPPN